MPFWHLCSLSHPEWGVRLYCSALSALARARQMGLGAASLSVLRQSGVNGAAPGGDALRLGWQEEWCPRNSFTGLMQQLFKRCIFCHYIPPQKLSMGLMSTT